MFASAHRWRLAVGESAPKQPPGLCPRKRWIDWADLLKRVWAWEVLAYACGATRRVLAAVPAGPIAEKSLRHLKLPTAAPMPARARLAAQTDFWDTGPPVDELGQAPAPHEYDQRLAECELLD